MLMKSVGISAAVAIYLVVLLMILRQLAVAPLSWRILGLSGVPLSLGGFGFASRFWHPSPGPYIANSVYPFGGHLNAWAVSFGFTWAALGLLFTGAVLLAWRQGGRLAWTVLLCSWILCWWPHALIGVAFASNGANRQSVDFYRHWASSSAGLTVIVSSSIYIVWLIVFSVAGFIGTGRAVWRR